MKRKNIEDYHENNDYSNTHPIKSDDEDENNYYNNILSSGNLNSNIFLDKMSTTTLDKFIKKSTYTSEKYNMNQENIEYNPIQTFYDHKERKNRESDNSGKRIDILIRNNLIKNLIPKNSQSFLDNTSLSKFDEETPIKNLQIDERKNFKNNIDKDFNKNICLTTNFIRQDILKKITSLLYKEIDPNDLYYFNMNPLSKNKTLICKIIKEKSTKLTDFFPSYSLFISSNDKFLLAAEKIYKTTSTTYYISKEKNNINEHSEDFLGKISSNFLGNKFNIFGKGKKPLKESIDKNEFRSQYGAIEYNINLFGLNGPRKMSVYLPKLNENDEICIHRPSDENDYLQELHKKKTSNCYYLTNKPPVWDDMYKTFGLNFNGRVQLKSPKNFQLIKDDEIILQFGMINNETFAMDFQFPLSPFQAFAICLSSLAPKKASE